MLRWPATAIIEKNKLASDAPFLVLVKMVHSELTEPICLVRNTESITWDGQEWQAYPMNFDINTIDGQTEPQLSWTVSNCAGTLQQYIQKFKGFTDAEVTIYVVHANMLDNTEPLQAFEFTVTTTQYDEEWVTFILGASPETVVKFPTHIYMAHYCPYRFKSVRCGYAGGKEPCNNTLETCRIPSRFGGEEGINGNNV